MIRMKKGISWWKMELCLRYVKMNKWTCLCCILYTKEIKKKIWKKKKKRHLLQSKWKFNEFWIAACSFVSKRLKNRKHHARGIKRTNDDPKDMYEENVLPSLLESFSSSSSKKSVASIALSVESEQINIYVYHK